LPDLRKNAKACRSFVERANDDRNNLQIAMDGICAGIYQPIGRSNA